MQGGALENILVLDLSQFLSGPRCTQLLAMKGATVIKIEPPMGEALRVLTTVMSADRMMSVVNPDKKGLVLDLKKDEGREIFLKLAEKADVVVENFAPGLMDEMGIGSGKLTALNPRLIYASISGFGRTGPMSDRLAFDIISQASGGIMSANNTPDKPPKVFFGDLVSGAYCAMAIFAALYQRERTGRGQVVDISMQDVMYFHNFGAHSTSSIGPDREKVSALLGRDLNHLLTDDKNPLPFWNSYAASDGHIALVALTERQWKNFMEAIGRPELVKDARFSNFAARARNAAEGTAIIKEWISRHTVAEAYEALTAARIPCSPVLDEEQVNSDAQLAARGMHATVAHAKKGEIRVPGDPLKMSDSPPGDLAACPDLGEHSAWALSEILGMGDEEIAELKKKRVI